MPCARGEGPAVAPDLAAARPSSARGAGTPPPSECMAVPSSARALPGNLEGIPSQGASEWVHDLVGKYERQEELFWGELAIRSLSG